jgi:hypothetical protein
VSQEQVVAKSGLWDDDTKKEVPTAKYDLKISHNLVDPWTMAVQDTFNLEVNITNTNPVTNLEFDIGEMLGHLDALSFGVPSVSFGSAYDRDNTKNTLEDAEGKVNNLDAIVSSSGKTSCYLN